ncbi:MAG: putative 4-hydroxybenzoate polyprenyltransferase [Blastocatellia bacterium]|nr:putative 4-hydroxybenzoate polyprenyltransferase [Blastocatellia bacterium]MCS7156436.1 putative 4-hydroxybenzoate polyprenyltransferase [Blastocatellia bacterium]MCX7751823.1 putative 4-hydroxybenzoate polyprenyltransferase [Blastocatellia bacterium]MDW8168925.1 UbiA-like polyprenyltransferase [Acidobacteriota bacterium]MDW8256685.1 UbiA-like polyprenyltransferase [Acidobacteriota bacterium]
MTTSVMSKMSARRSLAATLWQNTRVTLEMIKIEHTLFALPFALLGAILAANGLPDGRTLFWILVAMVGARSAAMAFNRLVDREFDRQNPRTQNRALPAGRVSPRYVRTFTVVSAAVFLLAAAMLNRLTLMLAPIALASIFLYSYTKRFTAYSHLVLGWCLAIAPTGAWIAVRGTLDDWLPLAISLAVMMWVAGFDVIYACQDVDFDRRVGLRSLPARFGLRRALWIARGFHGIAFASLVWAARLAEVGWLGGVGLVATLWLLIRQHRLVRPDDLSRVNEAFFTTNAYVSLVLLLTMGGDVLLR